METGSGWRRAFCTSSLPRNSDVDVDVTTYVEHSPTPSPRSCIRFGFFSNSNSNTSTPRLHCGTSNPSVDTPALLCKLANINPRPLLTSSESNSFRSQSNCGVCVQSAKTGQGTAIYTAECGHAFHFPCIAKHVRKEGKLACPVCVVNWKDVPLLAVQASSFDDKSMVAETKISTPKQQYHHCQLKPISVIRVYNDDESLLTPTAGAKFNPIPEADEEEEEEEENECGKEEDKVKEFQGFFVNPIQPCSVKPLMSNNSRTVYVKPMPEAAIVSVSQRHETYAIALRVKAPSTPHQSSSSPIDLIAVLDVSASMEGSKLHMLKRAMSLVISSLGAADRLSIVAFSATTKRLLPLRRMNLQGQLSAKHIINRLTCGQGSNARDALKKATKVLEDRREKNPMASIMLLSDGQSKTQRRERSHVSSTHFGHIEIPVHAFSYGKMGGDSHDAFAKYLGALLSVIVQDLQIKLKLDINGPAITAVYCNNFRPAFLGSDSIQLGNLYAEEEQELLVEIRVPAFIARTRPVLTARCSYRAPITQETINCREQTLLIPKFQPIRSTAPKIERLRNLFIATRAIAEARGLIEECDYSNAHRLLMSARALVLQTSTSDMTGREYVWGLEMEMMELAKQQQAEKQTVVRRQLRRKQDAWELGFVDENGDPLTPMSAWRAAEMLAKVAMIKKSLNKVSDLHGFENARF